MITIIELNENNHLFKGRKLVVINKSSQIKSEDEARAYSKHVYSYNDIKNNIVTEVKHFKIK